MKAAEDGVRFDASGPLNGARDRRIFIQRPVRSYVVVIANIGSKDPPQMRAGVPEENTIQRTKKRKSCIPTLQHQTSKMARIMTPSHNCCVLGRQFRNGWRNTGDRSRTAVLRFLADNHRRSAHSTTHRMTVGWVSCHSPRRISCVDTYCRKSPKSATSRTELSSEFGRVMAVSSNCRDQPGRLGCGGDLSLPKTRFEHIDGVARQGSDVQQHGQSVRSGACTVRPSRAKCEFSRDYNRRRISPEFAADALR